MLGATDPQGEAQEAPIIDSDIPDALSALASDDEGSASEGDGDECALLFRFFPVERPKLSRFGTASVGSHRPADSF